MNTLYFKIILRKDYLKKNGRYSVCLRINAGKTPKLFPLKFDVNENDFDVFNHRVKKSDPLHFFRNQIIQKAETKANIIIHNYAMNDKYLTIKAFSEDYMNDNYGSKCFYGYIEYLILKRDSELSPDTLDHYRKQLSKLRRFRPALTFSEVNETFILEYKDYMIRTLKNTPITWNKGLEFIKRVCNQAYKEDKLKSNPFKNLQINRLKGNYGHLIFDELKSLDKLYQEQTLPANRQNVLRYFLFSCYTGIRYGDMYLMRFVNLKEKDNIRFLDFTQHKSKKPIMIPLIDQAIQLIPAMEFEQQKIFDVKTDQETNRKLKEIMAVAKIEKRITFHSARHTCSNALFILDVPLDVRAQIIGDTKEVVSNHYTKEDMSVTIKALDKYSKAMKPKETDADPYPGTDINKNN